jgi:hypothetical protein
LRVLARPVYINVVKSVRYALAWCCALSTWPIAACGSHDRAPSEAPGFGGGAGMAGTSGTGATSGSGATGGTSGSGATGGAGGSGAIGGAGGSGAIGSVQLIADPPTYLGTVDNAAGCTKSYVTSGFEPATAEARHPLFLYFTGTNFFSDPAAFRQQAAPAVEAVNRAMARRGFVALWVAYDNGGVAWASDHVNQLACMFGDEPTDSVLEVACRLPQVDCELGIVTWGHSQGAYVAHMAANYEPRVRAAWLTGYGGEPKATLAKDRLRVVNAEGDTSNGTVAVLNQIAGFTSAECPDDGRGQCLRENGSGWIVVRRADCQVSSADHCWFDRKNCLDSVPVLEPNWVDPASTKAFALTSNADWVAATVRR